MSDIQLNRSSDLYDRDSKPKRNSAKNQIPAPSKASPDPGPWLTAVIEECCGLDRCNLSEEQESALEIAESFRLVSRYRRLKFPMGPHPRPNDWLDINNVRPDPPAKIFIADEFETLENCSLVFGDGIREAKDESANFPTVNQPYVLAGPDLQAYLATRPKSLVSLSNDLEVEQSEEIDEEPLYTDSDDEDLSDVLSEQPVSEEEVEAGECDEDEAEQPTAASNPVILTQVPVSDLEFCEHYARWYENPSAHEQVFSEKLAQFIYAKVRELWGGDTLRKRAEIDDLAQDFILETMEELVERRKAVNDGRIRRNGKPVKPIKNIAHYVTRSWTNAKRKEYKAIAEFDRQHPSEESHGVDANGEATTVNLSDKTAYASWSRGSNAAGEVRDETETEYLHRCKAMLGTIEDESLRDVAGLWMAMKTERQIAEELGISPQRVGRSKVKIKTALANVKGTAVLK